MPDNMLSVGGVRTATDEISEVHYPRRKVGWGVDGSYSDVSTAAPLPGASVITRSEAAQFARPANVTAYTAGDIINDDATAGGGASNDIEFANVPDSGVIKRVEVRSSAEATRATLRVWLFNAAPTIGAGDNEAFVSTVATLIGQVDLECDIVGSADTIGFGTADIPYNLPAGTTIYALLETVDGFTPASAETFDLALIVSSNA